MSTIALYQALKHANVPDTLAREAVEELARKADLSGLATTADVMELRQATKADMADLRHAIAQLNADLSRLIMTATIGGLLAMSTVLGTMLVIFKFWRP